MARRRLRLIQRRKTVGYTQEELANLLGMERSTVVRWEKGQTEPLPWVRPGLAGLLKLSADELDALLNDVTVVAGGDEAAAPAAPTLLDFSLTSDETVSVMEQFSARDLASRRQVLAELSVLTGDALLRSVRSWVASLPSGETHAEVGFDEVSQLEEAVKLFRRWDASGLGGLQRKAVVGQLNAMTETLNERRSPAIRQRLFSITAELAQLSGWMAYDQGLYGVAQRYYMLALHACRESANSELGAKIIGDMTQLSTALGHYDDSLSFVHTALYSLPRGSNPLVRSELLGLEARAYAHLGRSEAANAARSGESCVEVYHEGAVETRPDWIHYMNQAEVDCLAANTYIELALHETDATRTKRYAARAEHYTTNACERRGELYTRSRIF
ncbi:MAG: helix-turn-helix domain-containing protein [Streptosporangiales bacterium]|nr:helix-turn-helix domain-containing protein [Streptosporangiales bacterium]